MRWKIENVPELNGYTVEWAEAGNFFLSQRNILFHSEDLRPPYRQVAVVAAPSWKSLASRFRLAQRLLRFQVTNVIPLGNGDIFVTFDKTVGLIRDGRYQEVGGLARPCRVLRGACAVDKKGDVFFGEYLANDERGIMRIYRYQTGAEGLEVVYAFPAGSIKHVHGLYFDNTTGALFCLTGDDEKECRIVSSSDGFQTVEVVGEGDETWRAVSLLFDKDHLFYGTDAEFRANHIYQVERRTLARKNLGEVNGTVFYSKSLGLQHFFTTTAEDAPSQIENVAAIWLVEADGRCERLKSFEKDRWHPTLFQFGTIHFPGVNKLSNELYFHLVGVKEDNRTFRISRQD
jgi:hypothetical protein